MAFRRVSLVMMLGAAVMVSLAHDSAFTANAATPIFVGESAPGKRAVFRPLTQTEHRDVESAQQLAPRSSSEPHRRSAGVWAPSSKSGGVGLIREERAGARMAVPIVRGGELGLKFRPDGRADSDGDGQPASSHAQNSGALDSELHSNFRPIQPSRRPTYEELHAAPQPLQPMPVVPYPMMPLPPMPVYPPLRW